MSPDTAKPTFVTFYSFKGGVGRSMALINTAGILAGRRGFRVLVIDLDLEAPGLSYLDPELPDISPAQAQRELPLLPGFVDLFVDAKERGKEADLFKLSPGKLEEKYTQTIKIPDTLREFPDGSLRIMPAGRFDSNYAHRLDALNLSALYREGLGEPLVRVFKTRIASAGLYDYVLVDSRTGMSEGAGMCTRDLADHVMVLSGLNRQNVEGTCEFLREFRKATEGERKLQVILSPMPNGEDKLLDDRREAAAKAFEDAWGAKVDLSLEIPYHPQLALTEEPHIFRRRRGYLFEAYQEIETSMLRDLGHTAQAFRQQISKLLDEKVYDEALQNLRHMIRLNNGINNLLPLLEQLLRPRDLRRGLDSMGPGEPASVRSLLAEQGGQTVVRFLVENLFLGERDWITTRLLQELKKGSPQLRDRLVQRFAEVDGKDADALGNHALALEQSGDFDDAEKLYRLAIELEPQHFNNLWNYADFLEKRRGNLEAAKAFYTRAIENRTNDPGALATHALFLDRLGDFDGAEAYFKRALDADPKNAHNLGNYAVFLVNKRGEVAGAEVFYKRALEADPKNAHNLGNYALFLADKHGDMTGAEMLFKRALEADPRNARNLRNYSWFLWQERQDVAGAHALFKRALEADPQDASILSDYAVFLDRMRDSTENGNSLRTDGKDESVEAIYKQAIEAGQDSGMSLANYGQFLIGLGRLIEGECALLSALEQFDGADTGSLAEVCFSLWLGTRLQDREAESWEMGFKFLIQRGFERYSWTFDRMLKQAETKLLPEEFDYAKALAAAFLDEKRVPDLDRFERWRKLEPRNPKAQVAAAISG